MNAKIVEALTSYTKSVVNYAIKRAAHCDAKDRERTNHGVKVTVDEEGNASVDFDKEALLKVPLETVMRDLKATHLCQIEREIALLLAIHRIEGAREMAILLGVSADETKKIILRIAERASWRGFNLPS